MEDNHPERYFLKSIGLMLTYNCTVACPHCIVEAGPRRKEKMSIEKAINWITQISKYRDKHVECIALTGGEPFTSFEELKILSEYAKDNSLIVSVVTNASWAKTKKDALLTLNNLPAVHLISLSTDLYHQKAIPIDNIENAVWAIEELGLGYNLAVCKEDESSPEYVEMMEKLLRFTTKDKIVTSKTFPVGRAQKKADLLKHEIDTLPTQAACSMSSYPVIFPDGKVIGCIGPAITLQPPHPLYLGNLNEEPLSEILDRAENNTILHTIRIWGPHKLVVLLKNAGLERHLPSEYIKDCTCDVCYKLLSKKEVNEALSTITQDEAFIEEVAYGRVYYLKEEQMVHSLIL